MLPKPQELTLVEYVKSLKDKPEHYVIITADKYADFYYLSGVVKTYSDDFEINRRECQIRVSKTMIKFFVAKIGPDWRQYCMWQVSSVVFLNNPTLDLFYKTASRLRQISEVPFSIYYIKDEPR
jgi:hypothetical protein